MSRLQVAEAGAGAAGRIRTLRVTAPAVSPLLSLVSSGASKQQFSGTKRGGFAGSPSPRSP